MPSKKNTKKPTRSKGLGDTVEKVTKATGLDKVAKAVLGDDCGCNKRKEWLNAKFPYYRTLNPEDKKLYEQHLLGLGSGDQITGAQQRVMLDLISRTTGRRQSFTRCPECILNTLKELQTIYEASCDDTDTAPEGDQAES